MLFILFIACLNPQYTACLSCTGACVFSPLSPINSLQLHGLYPTRLLSVRCPWKIPEWVAMPSPREIFPNQDQTHVSASPALHRQILYAEPLGKALSYSRKSRILQNNEVGEWHSFWQTKTVYCFWCNVIENRNMKDWNVWENVEEKFIISG